MSYTEPEESEFNAGHEINSNFSASRLPSGEGYTSGGMPMFAQGRQMYHEIKPKKKTSQVRSKKAPSLHEREDSDAAGHDSDAAQILAQQPQILANKEVQFSKASRVSVSKLKKSTEFISPKSSERNSTKKDESSGYNYDKIKKSVKKRTVGSVLSQSGASESGNSRISRGSKQAFDPLNPMMGQSNRRFYHPHVKE